MDPVSAIGLASGILTFIDIGYKVVTGTLEIARTGQAPHTEHIDAVADDLNNAVARFSRHVSPNVPGPEKALREASVRCQTLSNELLALLGRFKVQTARPGMSWDKLRVVFRRIRSDPKVQELRNSLAEYRSQILVHLVTILTDRQLATQTQLGNSIGETRTDLCSIRDALKDVRVVLSKLEQAQMNTHPTTRPISDTDAPPPEHNTLSDKLLVQLQEAKDALYILQEERPEKTPETRILEHVYFGTSMFQRGETLKSADESTFRWFVEGVPSESYGDSGSINPRKRQRNEGPEGQNIRALKADVASRFEKWLRSGSGVFHISGKAGSGKSTLMKLILSMEHTNNLLKEWAGDKRLLFASFYFWAGGDHMQNSLEGLQRSILFEILIKRPELVKEVFHEAYSTISHSRWESPIHSRFFTTSSFHRAFGRLLHLQADTRYRLCLFIDGLDEYGADDISGSLPETQREDLAQSIVDWTSNAHVKVLASSRPYPEFSEVFAGDQQVLLHQLTYDDMIEFGSHLFERHRTFEFPGVKQRYQDLVERVSQASDGVFLWTGLTIQRLLASLSKRDSFEALEKQLEDTPRELNALYEKMFSAIDSHERVEAMKIMLLVSEERKFLGEEFNPGGINAMAISWLASLEDPEFPANQPFRVYTEDEIEEKRQFAESRVSGYTRGLLEVIPYPSAGLTIPQSFRRHTVQFFHKSALEYVIASPLARDVLSSSPNLFNLEFYARLSLAELHFGALTLDGERDRVWKFGWYMFIFEKCLATPNPCWPLIEAYRAAFDQLGPHILWRSLGIMLNGKGQFLRSAWDAQCPSFDHWIANEVPDCYGYGAQYLTEMVQKSPKLLHPQDGLSLLLSVACPGPGRGRGYSRLDRAKMFLDLGADLHHGTYLWLDGRRRVMELSVWQAWCLYYVTRELHRWFSRGREAYNDFETSRILQLFLETGANSDCYILLRQERSEILEEDETQSGSESEETAREQTIRRPLTTNPWSPSDKWMRFSSARRQFKTAYVISFREFIRQVKPVEHKQLERLLSKTDSIKEFSVAKLREIGEELATSKHPEFKSPEVRPVDFDQILADGKSKGLFVYWIRWKDATIPGSLELRLC